MRVVPYFCLFAIIVFPAHGAEKAIPTITSENAAQLPVIATELLRVGDFAGFTALVEQLGQSDIRNGWGWPLRDDALSELRRRYDATVPQYRLELRQGFRAALRDTPDKAAGYVILAHLLVAEAWQERGGAVASEVTDAGWKGFRDYLSRATTVLDDAAAHNIHDPQLLATAMTCAMAQSASTNERYDLLREGIALNPTYLPLFYNAAYAAIPRWSGGAGKVKRLAEWLAQETSETYGDALYFYAAVPLYDFDGVDAVLDGASMDPKRIIQGFDDFERTIGDAPYFAQRACHIACAAGMREHAATLFKTIPVGGSTWKVWSPALCETWRKWATSDGPAPADTPLHRAAATGDAAAFRTALENGAEINAVNEKGETALSLAVTSKHRPIVAACIIAGADPNSFPANWVSPLFTAVEDNDLSTVDDLLRLGADPNISLRNATGYPLHVAATLPDTACMERLLRVKGIDTEVLNYMGFTPLTYVAQKQRVEFMAPLLKAGANPNYVSWPFIGPFHMAASRGPLAAFQTIHEHGGDFALKAVDDWTVLHYASRSNHPDIVKYILDHGFPDVNIQDVDGFSPLHAAAHKGNIEAAEVLLAVPTIEINTQANDGSTPLHKAAAAGFESMVSLLISHGADPAIVNKEGQTAGEIAKDKGFAKIRQIL